MFRQTYDAITYVFTGFVILFVGVVINLVGPGVAHASLCHVTTSGNPNTATLTELTKDGVNIDYDSQTIVCSGGTAEFSPLTDNLSLNILDNQLVIKNLVEDPGGSGGEYTLGGLIWRDEFGTVVDGFIKFGSITLSSSFGLAAAGIELADFTSGKLAASESFIKFDTSGWAIPSFGTLTVDYEVSHVPLPTALPLFGTGLAILGFIGWRRRRKLAQAV